MNLLSILKEQLSSAAISKISGFLGETAENTTSALGNALPAILGGLMQKAATTQGTGELLNTIKTGGHDGSVFDKLGDVLNDVATTSTLASLGGGLMNNIFGNKATALSSIIAGVSGIQKGSATSLLNIAAPLVMGVLGKQVTSQGMGVSGLASLLMSQKDYVKDALPAGISSVLNLDSLGDFLGDSKTATSTKKILETEIEEDKKSMSWLPWALIGALLLGSLYYWKNCRGAATNTEMKANTTAVVASADSTASTAVGAIKRTLSTGVELNFGEKSIENELISFIEDPTKPVDKTTWFNFRDLRFQTGSAIIDSTSMNEVRNIAEILKAYPIELKIGGYTDNVGKEASNQRLSANRATSVVTALVKMGIEDKRLAPEGYGSQFPVASNKNEAGKAQNRRIAVRVTKK